MKEIFYEESSVPADGMKQAKIFRNFRTISIVLYIIGVIALLPGLSRGYVFFFDGGKDEYLYMFISSLIIGLIFIALALGFTMANRKINIIYDYVFVSGEIRISKVHGNRRKEIYVIKPSEILKIGKVFSEEYYRIKVSLHNRESRFTVNKIAADNKELYYFYCNTNTGKGLLILECKEEMIKNIAYYVSKDILELDK